MSYARASRGRAGLAGTLIFGALALLLLPQPTFAAQLFLVSTTPPVDATYGPSRLRIGIFSTGEEAPGDISLTLRWGEERDQPNALAALVLTSLPTLVRPGYSAVFGDDCQASVGALEGSCGMVFTLSHPPAPGPSSLAQLEFEYRLVPNPGFEFCYQGFEPGCIYANTAVRVFSAPGATVFGEPSDGVSYSLYSLATPGVRPIPEPSTSVLAALGLAVLSAGRKRRSASTRA